MKTIFLVGRINYFRFFLYLIEETKNRSINVEIWIIEDDIIQKGEKSYLYPSKDKIPEKCLDKEIRYIKSADIEKCLLDRNSTFFVFSLHFPSYYIAENNLEKYTNRWITIFTGPDSYFEIAEKHASSNLLSNGKLYFLTYSDYWWKQGIKYLEEYYPKNFLLKENLESTSIGHPEFDAFKSISKEVIKEKYKLPLDKEVFLYLPFPCALRNNKNPFEKLFTSFLNVQYTSSDNVTPRLFFKQLINRVISFLQVITTKSTRNLLLKGIKEENIFKAIKQFCEKENLYLIVKPRKKFPVSKYVISNADLVVWDDESQQDPPILKELLTVSRICFSYYSLSVLSSVFAKVFHLNASLPGDFFSGERSKFWFSDKNKSIFNYSGVCESWELEKVKTQLPKTNLRKLTIDKKSWIDYVNKYSGFSDYSSSKRCVDFLQNEKTKDDKD